MDANKIETLDSELIQAAKKIRVLKALEWPLGSEEMFLQNWRKGNPQLPEVNLKPQDLSENISTLESIVERCDEADPVEKFLAETANSYANSARMLSAVGTLEFTRYSTKIYGRPDTVYKLQGMSAVDSAKFFLEVTDALLGNANLP